MCILVPHRLSTIPKEGLQIEASPFNPCVAAQTVGVRGIHQDDDGVARRVHGADGEAFSVWRLTFGNRFGAELFPYLAYLLLRVFEGAGVVDNVVGGFDLFRFGELRGHAADDFFAGGVRV